MNILSRLIVPIIIVFALLGEGSTPLVVSAAATGNKELLDALNVAITDLVESGMYAKIYESWFSGNVTLMNDSTTTATASFPSSPTAGGTLANIIDSGIIVFGSDTTFPPFEFFDSNRNLTGFEVDLARAIAQELSSALGKTIIAKIQTENWDTIIPRLVGGNFDAILSAMTMTRDRALQVNFTQSYFTSTHGVLAGTSSPLYTDLTSLNNSSIIIGVQESTYADLYAQAHLQATIRAYSSTGLAIDALTQGDVHFVLGDGPNLGYYAVQHPTDNLSVVGTFGSFENFGMAVRPDTAITTSNSTSTATSEAASNTTRDVVSISNSTYLLSSSSLALPIPVASIFGSIFILASIITNKRQNTS